MRDMTFVRPAYGGVRVWDPLVRLFHWTLVLSFGTAWVTAHGSETIHHAAGYLAAALVGFRILWGLVGPNYARFSQFLRGPKTVAAYLAAIRKGREARHLGHNPAGGAMVVTLLGLMALAALSGWMMTTNAYYGVDWVEAMHSLVTHLLALLVLVHIAGVALASLRHRENLVRAMFDGRKRAPAPDDID